MSAASWVTSTAGMFCARMWSNTKARNWSRSAASSLEKGSSSKQRARLREQGAHERHAGALAAGERGRVALAVAGQFGVGQRLLHLLHALRARAGRHGEQQVFRHRHVGKQQRVLEQQADAAPGGGQAR